jgi:GNAT superfamily N-acetyltransferase
MNPDEIAAVCAHLRARDREELAAYGWTPDDALHAFRQRAVLSRVFCDGEGAQALIAFHAVTPACLAASLMATDRWPHVARRAYRWGHVTAKPFLLSQGFMRAECRTLDGHADAIRFLERLGFVRECHVPLFGARGAAFIQFAWRLNDHVPFQITQDAGATAAATT